MELDGLRHGQDLLREFLGLGDGGHFRLGGHASFPVGGQALDLGDHLVAVEVADDSQDDVVRGKESAVKRGTILPRERLDGLAPAQSRPAERVRTVDLRVKFHGGLGVGLLLRLVDGRQQLLLLALKRLLGKVGFRETFEQKTQPQVTVRRHHFHRSSGRAQVQ